MMTYLKSLFSPDETRRAEQAQADQAPKLEMDEPIAGADAQIIQRTCKQ